jgi:hypothetical protein
VREVRADAAEAGTSLVLHGDDEGHWRDAGGTPLPHLDGCIDVDLHWRGACGCAEPTTDARAQ